MVNKKNSSSAPIRCGIVLAGGNGQRLQPFIRRLRGDHLPKQYVNFIGTRSMLEHTFHRAEKLISPECLFTVVAAEHVRNSEACRQLTGRLEDTVVIQPSNKDTAPGILLPLTHLYKRYPASAVAIFPSDHFVLEEDRFMHHVDQAFRLVERDSTRVVLLGIEPDEPDPEYGYILPGRKLGKIGPAGIQKVKAFIEKPLQDAAHELIRRGGLWNTMVIVSGAHTLLNLVKISTPGLYSNFQGILKAIGTRGEKEAVEAVYQGLRPANFSKEILEPLASSRRSNLCVLRVSRVFWSDWGLAHRIVMTLRRAGLLERVRASEEELFKISHERVA